jgi:hypothetical protein
MKRIALVCVLVGCVGEDELLELDGGVPWGGPVLSQAPPPATLVASMDNLFVGYSSQIRVEGGVQGERVHLAVTTGGPGAGPCPAVLGGQCLGLGGQVMYMGAVPLRRGDTLTLTIPSPPSVGTEYCLQAAIPRGVNGADSALSQVVCRTVFPAFELQPGPNESRDIWSTSVYAYAPGMVFPGGGLNNEELRLGGWGDTYQALIDIDVAGAPPIASSARLELTTIANGVRANTDAVLDRIDAPWDWRTQGTGADRERLWWSDLPPATQIGGPFPAQADGTVLSLDITDLYNDWMDGTAGAYGVQLRPTATWNQWWFFASSEAVDPALRPRLVVEP